MKRFSFAALVLILAATSASADIDPTKCICTLDQTQRLLIIPATSPNSPYCSFTLTIRNSANNPVNDALVEVIVGGLAERRTKLCAGTVTTGHTNASGIATFNIPGGGCMKDAEACIIRVNEIPIRDYSVVVSPDYAGHDNTGLPDRWDLCVTLLDFPSFGAAYGLAGPSCHDYNNNGYTDLADFTLFASHFNRCCAG